MAPLKPDVLAVQEVEPIDGVRAFEGEVQPTYRDRLCDPAFPRRAAAMFSYSETELRAVDLAEPMYSFRRYEARRGSLEFQVIGVWPFATKSVETSYRQAHDGLTRHADWIRQRPTVILGDFNANARFTGKNWSQLQDLTQSLGLVSAYHHHFNESFGAETRPTHFHRGKEAAAFHLDYCFLPSEWTQAIRKVEVGAYAVWHKLSDHVPLVIDLDLEG
jgi:hypothetical protein